MIFADAIFTDVIFVTPAVSVSDGRFFTVFSCEFKHLDLK